MQRLTNKDLVLHPNPILKKRLSKVSFPLEDSLKEKLILMRKYVVESFNPALAEKYDLTPAVGIAANQIGIDARMCVVYIEDEDKNVILDLSMINPIILSSSAEQSYIESGEGCLSIPERPSGFVYRSRIIKVKYYDFEGNSHIIELDDFESIAVQHEIDHLNGILYFERINENDPFEVKENAYKI